MRSEQEMMKLILDYAKSNCHVKAVYMNGSRANPSAEKDNCRDYDVVYVVDDPKPFMDDMSWLHYFGNIAVLQDPNANGLLLYGAEVDTPDRYNWLVLYEDHNRLDISISTDTLAVKEVQRDSCSVILLDKNHILPDIAPPSDRDYYVRPPSQSLYYACVNNFWWCLQNVAKGLVRRQLPYAMNMYHGVVRDMLHRMIDWHIGCKQNFSVSVGMWGKYYRKYLRSDLYALYEKTYSDADYENFWAAVYSACDLFHRVSLSVSDSLGFAYPVSDEDNMLRYLHYMRTKRSRNT